MKRYIRLCLLTVMVLGMFAFSSISSHAQLQGLLHADSVRVLLKDSTYTVLQEYLIEGTLIIEPGTTIQFNDNGRFVVAAGGRLIADGFATLATGTLPPAPSVVDNYTDGFADMRFFFSTTHARLKAPGMERRERTIHPEKYNHIFNVAIDTVNRRLVNITNPYNSELWPVNDEATGNGVYSAHHYRTNSSNSNVVIVPFETAILYMAARMNRAPSSDVGLRLHPWSRTNTGTGTPVSVDVTANTIRFFGQPQNQNSREWGHIIVMPGARAAFFRNCEFEHFKKDTTVDNKPYFTAQSPIVQAKGLNNVDLQRLNNEMLRLSNGGGGAITTFSSRTWVLDSRFNRNFARNRGGAMQILQTPTSFFYPNQTIPRNSNGIPVDLVGIPRFNFDDINRVKNIRVSDADKHTSTVLTRNADVYQRYPMIDRIDEVNAEFWTDRGGDFGRIPWDDARLAGYLGRFRNLEFTNNMVRLANTTLIQDGNGQDLIGDNLTQRVPYPLRWGNMAYGGALYIAGTEDDSRQIEFTLGMNDSIRLGILGNLQNPNAVGAGSAAYKDYIRFVNNSAHNFQDSRSSGGAKGGAIYVGKNTSVIIAGAFIDNFVDAKWLVDTTTEGTYNDGNATSYLNNITFTQGGAIYSNPAEFGRIQIRGDRTKDNMMRRGATFNAVTVPQIDVLDDGGVNISPLYATKFVRNKAGAGGAIYVAHSSDVLMSPQIGGSDENTALNNFGWRIRFSNNYAYGAGGAIFSKRNMDVTGAGGARDNYHYSLAHLTRFDTNKAAFAGGAIYVEAGHEVRHDTDTNYVVANTRIANFRRANFRGNTVGELAFTNIDDVNNQLIDDVRGGGAIYALYTDLNVVRAVHFDNNQVFNSNGAAVQMVNPYFKTPRMFITDLDLVEYYPLPANAKLGTPLVAKNYYSIDNPFTFGANYDDANPKYVVEYPAELRKNADGSLFRFPNGHPRAGQFDTLLHSGLVRQPVSGMLNVFSSNEAIVEDSIGQHQMNHYGNTQMRAGYLMPNTAIASQWWFGPNDGFIGGTKANLINVTWTPSTDWRWSARFNDSLWPNHNITSIHFVNGNEGYIADNKGRINKTTNKGLTWETVLNVNDAVTSINDITFIGSQNVGYAVTSNGRIYRTTGGNAWIEANQRFNRTLNSVYAVNTNLAYVVGSGGFIAKTTNGGADWIEIPAPGLNNINLNKVYFTNSNRGYVVGEGGILLTTTDGGDAWDIDPNFSTSEELLTVAFWGQNIGYITTSAGTIYKTENGGTTWTLLPEVFGSRINSIFINNANTVMIAGDNDLLYRTTDGGATWHSLEATNKAVQEGNPRLHGGIAGLVENGIGLGGALYILDFQNENWKQRTDSIRFNRTRIIDNFAFTGSAIYSDNYNLKLMFNRSLIRGNRTCINNIIGQDQNHISGPFNRDNAFGAQEKNLASSDLAAATIYGEIQGPYPTMAFSIAANSIFENDARFLIRLPDAPNTKGILAGFESGVGHGGVDTLVGNYWGKTEANVRLRILNRQWEAGGNPLPNDGYSTFFVEKRERGTKNPLRATVNWLPFFNRLDGDNRRQGPFEYNNSDFQGSPGPGGFSYTPIDLKNQGAGVSGATIDETVPAEGTIPERYLFSFDIYDLYDKGTDIKAADYSRRRMFPIEDFAVGGPMQLFLDHSDYFDNYDPRTDETRKEKYVKRWIRDPEFANAFGINGDTLYPALARLQKPWAPLLPNPNDNNLTPRYYHPLGMPIYLETKGRINIGDATSTNRDLNRQSSTVFFVINETTTDFIRVELKQIPRRHGEADSIWADDIFRGTVFLVPDSTNRGNPVNRRSAENLFNLGSNGTFPFGSDPDYGVAGAGVPEMLRRIAPRHIASDTLNGIFNAARNEDFAALGGRKYSANSNLDRTNFNLGNLARLFSNRDIDGNPKMPEDNDVPPSNQMSKNTYFAGERFGTLPANVGDVIRVVSRNVLWRQGITRAFDGGLVFVVTRDVETPVWSGDVVMYDTPELNPYVTDRDGNYPLLPNDRQNMDGTYNKDTVKNHGLLNKVFLQTNREYPAAPGTYSHPSRPANVRGTDIILTALARDRNEFYDPRIEMDLFTGQYTGLIYEWRINGTNTGLEHWLMVDTLTQDIPVDVPGIGSVIHRGGLRFKGVPLNPYIVPGGEKINVTARNFAPGIYMLDSLRIALTAEGMSEEDIEKILTQYYRTFPSYMNTPLYNRDVEIDEDGNETLVARFLQQDTIGIFGGPITSKDLTIYVGDSLPRFIAYRPGAGTITTYNGIGWNTGDNPATFKVKNAAGNGYENRPYSWSRFQAGQTNQIFNIDAAPKYLVNLLYGNEAPASLPNINQLRFRMDINTDDEMEDLSAEERNWDFRFGRTAYSFANTAVSASGDTLLVDTATITDAFGYTVTGQLKPSWMQFEYFMNYNNHEVQDQFFMNFQRRGQMNLRIGAAEALEMLRSRDRDNYYNTDTVMAIVANNGHGSVATEFVDLFVNFQPQFLTEGLADANEGLEYNMRLDTGISWNSARAIRIFDANPNQIHTFQIIEPGNWQVALDPSFPEETTVTFEGSSPYIFEICPRTGEPWLQINVWSGVLSGIPPIIKNLNDTNAFVTVLVRDQEGLANIRRYALKIVDVNSAPTISVAPIMNCLTVGEPVYEELIVRDRDLVRTGTPVEQLTITVVSPATGLEIFPSTINGGMDYDTAHVTLRHTGTGFTYNQFELVDGRLPVVIRVTDRAGLTDEITIYFRVSEAPTFLSTLTVSNNLGTQVLEWGTAPNATTGLGNDGNPAGILDNVAPRNYCEIEVPPFPPLGVFDARWAITTGISGLYRNIYPTAVPTSVDTIVEHRYIGTFRPGIDNTQDNYVTLSWNPQTVPAKNDNTKNPTGATWWLVDNITSGNHFSIDMRDVGNRWISSSVIWTAVSPTLVEVKILDPAAITGFAIIHDWYSTSVENDYNFTTDIGVSPNPVTSTTEEAIVTFEVNKSGNVYIELFDVLGNKVAVIADDYFRAGPHTVKFNLRDFTGSKLASGSYQIRMSTGMESKTIGLIVLQ